MKRKFLNSPIGAIPQSGYSGDRHSKNSIEWLLYLKKIKNDQGNNIRIQHATTNEGEKIVVYTQNVKRPVRYKLDGYLNMMVGNLLVNIMVVIGMVVLHAFKVTEKAQ